MLGSRDHSSTQKLGVARLLAKTLSATLPKAATVPMKIDTRPRFRIFLALLVCTALALCALRGEALAKEDLSDFREAPIEQLVAPSALPLLFLVRVPVVVDTSSSRFATVSERDAVRTIEETVLLPGHGASDLSPPNQKTSA